MNLTTIQVGKAIVRTKDEKINFLLNKKLLKKIWKEYFIDEDTGHVVTIKRNINEAKRWMKHPELNRLIFRKFKSAKKIS
jgi:hypothetical protein